MSAQILGAMCASGVAYANYKSAIDHLEGGRHLQTVSGYSETATAGIFSTYPAEFVTKTGQDFSELIANTLLMFLMYALKDDGNIGAGNLAPLGLFFIITGTGGKLGLPISSQLMHLFICILDIGSPVASSTHALATGSFCSVRISY